MKLVRFGTTGFERPGVLENDGNIRDLSARILDIGGRILLPDEIARFASLDMNTLPIAAGEARLGPCVSPIRSSPASASTIRITPLRPGW